MGDFLASTQMISKNILFLKFTPSEYNTVNHIWFWKIKNKLQMIQFILQKENFVISLFFYLLFLFVISLSK